MLEHDSKASILPVEAGITFDAALAQKQMLCYTDKYWWNVDS